MIRCSALKAAATIELPTLTTSTISSDEAVRSSLPEEY